MRIKTTHTLAIGCAFLLAAIYPAFAGGQSIAAKQAARREVAITIDDLPATHSAPEIMKYVTEKLVASLKANSVPAVGFVNEGKLYVGDKVDQRRVELLRMWLAAGFELGNHTFSHVAIDQTPIASYKQNVIRGEVVTRALLAERGLKLRYFRHTQLRTGPSLEYKRELEKFLANRGYTIAPVTIDNNDFIFADVYAKARQGGDAQTMKRVVDAYIPYMEAIFSFFEKLSVDSLGYEVKQTLLLHANELNADHFDDLGRMMKARGYKFISLGEALKDPAYRLADAQVEKGLSWLHRWMLAKGEKLRPEPNEPEFITQMFRTYQR